MHFRHAEVAASGQGFLILREMPPATLYVATTNAGKLRDFAAAAGKFQVAIEALPNLKEISEPVEDGATFEANARLKAEYYSRHAPGLWVLADDSGLEVDALDGAPGVRSARFADDGGYRGTGTTDERNNANLLERLAAVPPDLRTARYRCVLAVARDGDTLNVASGAVEGVVLTQPRGDGGFGYDPLFLIPQLSRTMAEVDLETKYLLSHRGQALRALFELWQ